MEDRPRNARPGSGEHPPADGWPDLRQRLSRANAAYVAEHAGEGASLPPRPRLSLLVVCCMDCRLTGRLEAALGLAPGDAAMVRVAGNTFGGTDDLTRSVLAGALVLGVRYVLVVGHTDCGMAKSDPAALAQRLRERGVARVETAGAPLGEWLGVFRDEAQNVRDTVARLRESPALPRDVRVEGALFEVASGELTWLET